ncbi:excalibur calcium-binding domain-containing protein [Bacillus badius]|uniref:excalibur calcium-binding domain-containing protein n=1 Tax=Bacillus badius TaxID=1455 RepID=UPI002E1BC0A3|nr:excalibur calcium-binding domain-containing protein [Bacillus badius]
MGEKKESELELTKRLIRERHPEAWLIEYASIGEKLNVSEFGAFTRDKLTTYKLVDKKKLIKTGEIIWPREQHGEVDHYAIKSIFYIDGLKFVTGNNGKDVQKFLEGEKKDSFTKVPRAFYQKIPGFRSNKRWKQVTAVIGYLFVLFSVIGFFNSNDEQETAKKVKKEETVTVDKKEEIAKPVVKKKEPEEVKRNQDSNKPVTLKSGEFKAGEDIAPGKYTVSTDEFGGNFAVHRNDDLEVNEMLGTELDPPLMVPEINIELKKGDLITISKIEETTFTPGHKEGIANPQADGKSATLSETETELVEEPATVEEPDFEPQQENVYYKNCAAVRAAGAAPIYRGDPGYGSHLDREGDGVACEQ